MGWGTDLLFPILLVICSRLLLETQWKHLLKNQSLLQGIITSKPPFLSELSVAEFLWELKTVQNGTIRQERTVMPPPCTPTEQEASGPRGLLEAQYVPGTTKLSSPPWHSWQAQGCRNCCDYEIQSCDIWDAMPTVLWINLSWVWIFLSCFKT